MPQHVLKPGLSGRARRLRAAGATLAAGALAATAIAVITPAGAITTVPSTEVNSSGYPVLRDDTATIKVDKSAMSYTRIATNSNLTTAQTNAFNANFTGPRTAASVALSGCKGDVVNGDPATTDASPRTIVTVKDPDGVVVKTATSPVRDLSAGAFFSLPSKGGQQMSPDPAPSASNYRGDFGDTNFHGFTVSVPLTKPGIYTVSTLDRNSVRTQWGKGGFNPVAGTVCAFGHPNVTSSGLGNQILQDVAVETKFEYRPWQYNFVDVFGNGKVSANSIPRENKFTVGPTTTPIYAGTTANTTFYTLPSGAPFALPSDPAACAADPASCLPSTAVKCEPTSCTPRLMIINEPIGKEPTTPNGLVGVFDLQTKAFIALAKAGGSQRILTSLGTDLDKKYKDILAKLATVASAQGIDLNTLLATKIRIRNGQYETGLSLLNGLQIDPSTAKSGIQIVSDGTVQAGIIFNLYLDLNSAACTTQSADSDPESPAPDRIKSTSGYGYTVTKSDLLPKVPAAGPLGAIVGGPVYHITSKFSPTPLANLTSAVLGVDTAADEPNGYPIWVNPFLSGSANVAVAKTLDFVGTATWSASETSLGSAGCFISDLMLGTGVAILNNPLGAIGLGTIFDPLATPSPAAQQLTNTVDAAVNTVVAAVTSNALVDSTLTQITGLLPLAP